LHIIYDSWSIFKSIEAVYISGKNLQSRNSQILSIHLPFSISTVILDGKKIASETYEKLRAQIEWLQEKPVLWAVLVWENNSPSMRYIRQKRRECRKIGMWFELYQFPEDISEEALQSEIISLNNNTKISGYIVQLPLPNHIDALKIIRNIDPLKDVDGFHPENQGKIVLWDGTGFTPCTPAGIMKIFEYYNINLLGKNIKILGQSNIVGKPMAQLCINAWATVTSCNSKTKNLAEHTKHADIIISATGRAHLLTADMVSPGATIIDVWFSVIDDIVYWDADYKNILSTGNAITPVPGWVWPMTVAMLLSNPLQAHIMHHDSQ